MGYRIQQIDSCQWDYDMASQARAKRADSSCCPALMTAPLSSSEAEETAAILSALADPVCLRLLSLVAAEDEVCSCNLEGPLDRSQPTISHHTRILAEAGLIKGEKRGRWTWWRVVPERLETLRTLLG
jgi:ArsR family transcriptional regulator, arsenate/arsenite/antimonite-responsive transcriptional repressor